MQISNLKESHPHIYSRILECQKERGNEPDDSKDLNGDKTVGNFTWSETKEGYDFWLDISNGRFQVFYDRYPMNVPTMFIPGSEIHLSPKADTPLEAPAHYDNSKGSLYKVATERKWNAYLFDVVKRLERGGKKDPLKQEIEKSIFVLQLWLKEQDGTDATNAD